MAKITAAITGVGQYLPDYILTNEELSKMVDTSDEWIMSHIGVKTRHILKGEGVYLMKHLKGGVKKGAFDDAEAQKRFDAWKNSKDAKISAVREGDAKAKKEAAAKELEAEKKMNEAIAKKVADKKAAAAAAEAEAKAAEEAPAEEAPAEA